MIVGTEMNAPGNKFVDTFDMAELKPLVPVFLRGAYIVCAHTVLQCQGGWGYLSAWTRRHFTSPFEKNAFFETVGRSLRPERPLQGLAEDPSPDDIIAEVI